MRELHLLWQLHGGALDDRYCRNPPLRRARRVLGHSYTPTIYKELAGLDYVRFEREPEDLAAFMTGDEWEGTNVTIPYKRAVMDYLDELSPLAERMATSTPSRV